MADASLVDSFVLAGLPKAKAEQTAKNAKVAPVLARIIASSGITDASKNPKQGNLLVHLATVGQQQQVPEGDLDLLAQRIVDGRFTSLDQVNAGITYLKDGGNRDSDKLDKACGVGVVVSPEAVSSGVAKYMANNAAALAQTTWSSLSGAMAALKLDSELRWANPLDIKKGLEDAYTSTFGTKEDYNKAQAAAKQAAKQAGKGKQDASSSSSSGKAAADPSSGNAEASTSSSVNAANPLSTTNMFEEGFLAKLHPVGGNPQKYEKLKELHLKATNGLVHTRFPPEPNGYLHIGHSKAIAINFGFAQYHGGHCYLRYDDTNPEAEEQVYIDSCLDIIRWLGFEPWKITYSSDHFQTLYELAVELIKRDKAYMCYCTAEQMNADRGGMERGPRRACEHRNRPVEDSLKEYERMKNGEFEPGKAVLRMKQDLSDGNPQMWDLVAYRTLKAPHHRTGTKWCIYPTYDFTHCLVDSFENITHSLCTTEFVQSRVSYEWLCDALDVYKPRQSEYGRLKLQGTFLSKRKILNLVNKGLVQGWDDPRLYTLIALRRRGIPPGAILSFVNGLGVTTATTTLGTHRFEQAIRSYLELTTPRLMLVLEPLKVTLTNVPEGYVEWVEKPLHSKDASMGSNRVPLTRTLYIERADFRTEDSKDFFRLAPGKTVGLLYASHPIKCTSFTTDSSTGEATEIFAEFVGFTDPADKSAAASSATAPAGKVKTYIHWVAEHSESKSPVDVSETRIFKQLFKSDDPAALDDYVSDVDPGSLQIIRGAKLEMGIWDLIRQIRDKDRSKKANEEQSAITSDPSATLSGGTTGGNERVRFQGLRTAYFCIDKDAEVAALRNDGTTTTSAATEIPASGDKLILNKIVSLKEDKAR